MDEQSSPTPSSEPADAGQPKPSFWKRQTNETPTIPQKVFDVIVGAALPVALFIADPVLFKGMGCAGYAVTYSPMVYFAVALGIISLLVWLFAPVHTGYAPAVLAGVFYTGETLAIVIGLLLMPLSILGLTVGLGVLGFLPFLVAYVYWRNAVRADRLAKSMEFSKGRLSSLKWAGALAVLIIPGLIQLIASNSVRISMDRIRHQANPGDVATAISELKTTHIVCLGLCGPFIGSELMSLPRGQFDYADMNGFIEQVTGAPPDQSCIANTQYSD